jgi:hypothetical protein
MDRKVIILNGYEIRDTIKRLGGTFRAADKAWVISQEGYAGLVERNRPSYGMAYTRGYAKIVAYSEL